MCINIIKCILNVLCILYVWKVLRKLYNYMYIIQEEREKEKNVPVIN